MKERSFRIELYSNYLGVSQGVDLVHGVSGGASGLPVEVVALHEDGVVGLAADPHVALAHQVELDALADVEARAVAGLGAVHVGERAQAEAVAAGGVHVTVHGYGAPSARNFERFADLEKTESMFSVSVLCL